MNTCKVCDQSVSCAHFNIDFKPVPICESCANSITLQQTEDLIKNAPDAESLMEFQKAEKQSA